MEKEKLNLENVYSNSLYCTLCIGCTLTEFLVIAAQWFDGE